MISPDLNAVAERLLNFQYHWEAIGKPFEWKFTRRDRQASYQVSIQSRRRLKYVCVLMKRPI